MFNIISHKPYPTCQLLNVIFYEYTIKDFIKIQKKSDTFHQLKEYLPKYTFNKINKVIESAYYYQFLGQCEDDKYDVEQEKFILFELIFATELLQEEINNDGIEDLFNEYKINLHSITPYIYLNEYDERIIPISTNIIFDFQYQGYDEPELSFSLKGYLDKNFNLITLEK